MPDDPLPVPTPSPWLKHAENWQVVKATRAAKLAARANSNKLEQSAKETPWQDWLSGQKTSPAGKTQKQPTPGSLLAMAQRGAEFRTLLQPDVNHEIARRMPRTVTAARPCRATKTEKQQLELLIQDELDLARSKGETHTFRNEQERKRWALERRAARGIVEGNGSGTYTAKGRARHLS